MLRISVLMPVRNAIGTLRESIMSLQNQTLEDFEIIVVDDGSDDDGTVDLLKTWAETDPRLRLLQQPHKGIVHALNAGLEICSAPLVARMDADDRASPDRLIRQVDFLERQPEIDVVGCRVAGFSTGQISGGLQAYLEWQNGLLEDGEICREIFVESPLAHPSVAYRREAVLRIGGYEEHGWAEDYDLWLRLFLAGRRFAKLPEVLLEWREHPERLTRTDRRYSLENFLRAKAHYLMLGPLSGRDAVIIWGAGMVGRRLGKQLIRLGAPLSAYVDIDPEKIGKTRHGLPIIQSDKLPVLWKSYTNPILLAAVGARKARPKIRDRLQAMKLLEGADWWWVA